MGKRKLRNCSNCGARHGPPTGKNCPHLGKQEEVPSEKQAAEAAPEMAESGSEDGDLASVFF